MNPWNKLALELNTPQILIHLRFFLCSSFSCPNLPLPVTGKDHQNIVKKGKIKGLH